jgi:hypothetical protein
VSNVGPARYSGDMLAVVLDQISEMTATQFLNGDGTCRAPSMLKLAALETHRQHCPVCRGR